MGDGYCNEQTRSIQGIYTDNSRIPTSIEDDEEKPFWAGLDDSYKIDQEMKVKALAKKRKEKRDAYIVFEKARIKEEEKLQKEKREENERQNEKQLEREKQQENEKKAVIVTKVKRRKHTRKKLNKENLCTPEEKTAPVEDSSFTKNDENSDVSAPSEGKVQANVEQVMLSEKELEEKKLKEEEEKLKEEELEKLRITEE